MRMEELKAGDVLLLPKEHAEGVYRFIEDNFGNRVADILTRIENHDYIHAELYIGNGYAIGAWFNGVHIYKIPVQHLALYHVYRPVRDIKMEDLKKSVVKHFNLPYAFDQLLLTGVIKAISLGNEVLYNTFTSYFDLPSTDRVICSELVAQILRDCGVYISTLKPEFVTPDHIAQSKEFVRII